MSGDVDDLPHVWLRYAPRQTLVNLSRKNPEALFVSVIAPCVARNGVLVEIERRNKLVFVALVARRGLLTAAEIMEMLWGDDPEGGPDCPATLINQSLIAARLAAVALGLRIKTQGHRGYEARPLRVAVPMEAAQ